MSRLDRVHGVANGLATGGFLAGSCQKQGEGSVSGTDNSA